MKILISVIVPAYNEEKLIYNCLLNLLNQDFGKDNYEVIVIDNNSSNNTLDIAKKFDVKILREKNRGVTYAIRRGFIEASGEIIAITDADTIVSNKWLSNIYQAFKDNSDPIMVGGSSIIRPRKFLSIISEFLINYVGIEGVKYCFKGLINLLSLMISGKPIYINMVNIRR